MIRDTLNIMNINQKSREEITSSAKAEQERRVYTGKLLKLTPEEKKEKIDLFQEQRENY